MTTQRNSDEIRTRILTENTAQSVLNHLKALESNRAHMSTRWIWELLQNARDTSVNTNTNLVASIEHKPGEIVFQHNGPRFKIDEIAHLIYHGSTKVEDAETIGQYGSGFLATHLLSPEINISGQLDDGKSFAFSLKRKGSVQELSKSMDRAWEEFNASSTAPALGDFTTQFRYPIEDDAVDAVNDGLAMLKRCAPFVVVFNKQFSRIDIKTPSEVTSFEVTKRSELSQVGLQKIEVSENESGNQNNKVYLMAENEKTAVATPLESMDDGQVYLSINSIPKLFLGFPIVGTEKFSFPAVINSFEFTPTEERDGVYIGRSDDNANHKNQAVIEGACELLVELLKFAASSGWHNIHLLTEVPAVQERTWLNTDWLRECLKEQLIEKIRKTPAVINENGVARTPEMARLPLAETDEGVKALWDLLGGWDGGSEVLPRRSEVVGWCSAIRSWADVSQKEPESLFSVIIMDGRKLASTIQENTRKGSTWGKIGDLQGLLRKDVLAVEWLNQLHHFFNENNLRDVRSEYYIVIDQDGFLDRLSNLHYDRGIDKELKDLAELLDWSIREELRDTQLTSLDKEVGAGEWKNEDVVGALIDKLQKRFDNNQDDNLKQASARLFAWIVHQNDWNRLQGFPVFTKKGDFVRCGGGGGEPLLAPVSAWQEDLKQFDDLFPPDRILADDFKVCDPEAWEQLDKQDLIRKSMIITRNETDLTKLSPYVDQEGSHETTSCITVTDIVERDAIIRQVRNSQDRAFLFWRFLTEWFIKEHGQGLDIQEALCTCKETHEYYSAAWLMPVRKTEWIRLKGNSGRVEPNAQSLANLLRDNEWKYGLLSKNPFAIKLLEAIDVNLSDLKLHLITDNDETRVELVDSMTELYHVVQGNFGQINAVVRNIRDDNKFIEYLEKREKERKRVHENQNLGRQVEELVQENLEGESFTVKRKPIGSDFEIEHDSVEIELAQGDQSWLVEVKATRSKEVRMTFTQAKTAVDEKNRFLLCVVPLDPGDINLELDTIRTKMRFVKNIGYLVDQLCDNLDELEDFREAITGSTSSGVRLEVISGSDTARFRVASSVWENDGFPLENLAEQLK